MRATSWSADKTTSAREEVDVNVSDIDDLLLVLTPGADVSGRVVVEGVNPPDLDSSTVHLRPRDTVGILYMSLMADVHDGDFTIPNIADNYYLEWRGLPDGVDSRS